MQGLLEDLPNCALESQAAFRLSKKLTRRRQQRTAAKFRFETVNGPNSDEERQ